MTQDAKKFIVDFTDEITREELVEMIDHALASICMLPNDDESINLRKSAISAPLVFLHNLLYNLKNN